MQRIQLWTDESGFRYQGDRYNLFGALAIEESVFGKFIHQMHQKRLQRKYLGTLHANEFDGRSYTKWALLNDWIDIFASEKKALFISFIFKHDPIWEERHGGQEGYLANQLAQLFVKKLRNHPYLNFFSEVDSIKMIYDFKGEVRAELSDPNVPPRIVHNLENIWVARIQKRIVRSIDNYVTNKKVNFKFTFANDECFDTLQLADALTYIATQCSKAVLGDNYKQGWALLKNKITNTSFNNCNMDAKFNFFAAKDIENIFS